MTDTRIARTEPVLVALDGTHPAATNFQHLAISAPRSGWLKTPIHVEICMVQHWSLTILRPSFTHFQLFEVFLGFARHFGLSWSELQHSHERPTSTQE